MKLLNSGDARLAREGLLRPDQVRTLELEALVDTGATDLVLPGDVVSRLGLPEIDRRRIRLADGSEREVSKVCASGCPSRGIVPRRWAPPSTRTLRRGKARL
jgi:hypothetical protein